MSNTCTICGAPNPEKQVSYNHDSIWVNCPVCGRYVATVGFHTRNALPKDMIASYLYHNAVSRNSKQSSDYTCFLGLPSEYETEKQNDNNLHLVTSEEIEAFYPLKFSERIDKILLALAHKSQYFGDVLSISSEEMQSLLFISRFDRNNNVLSESDINTQRVRLLQYLHSNGYVHHSQSSDFEDYYWLLSDGWKRVDEIEKGSINSKNVFVSMAFNDGTKNTREAIRNGIIDAGFSPEFIDEIIHNKQIVPEMFRLIRESRFLILDISDPNYGAYYEAGYALGLGKEVIITCSEEVFRKEYKTDEEKRYMKYLKPHFDILQKQILVWKDHTDLTKQLSEWIKALF